MGLCGLGHEVPQGKLLCPLCGLGVLAGATTQKPEPSADSTATSAEAVSEPASPILSPDGRYVWSGAGWEPLSQSQPPPIAPLDVLDEGTPHASLAVSDRSSRRWRLIALASVLLLCGGSAVWARTARHGGESFTRSVLASESAPQGCTRSSGDALYATYYCSTASDTVLRYGPTLSRAVCHDDWWASMPLETRSDPRFGQSELIISEKRRYAIEKITFYPRGADPRDVFDAGQVNLDIGVPHHPDAFEVECYQQSTQTFGKPVSLSDAERLLASAKMPVNPSQPVAPAATVPTTTFGLDAQWTSLAKGPNLEKAKAVRTAAACVALGNSVVHQYALDASVGSWNSGNQDVQSAFGNTGISAALIDASKNTPEINIDHYDLAGMEKALRANLPSSCATYYPAS